MYVMCCLADVINDDDDDIKQIPKTHCIITD